MKKNVVPTRLWSRRVTEEQASALEAALGQLRGSTQTAPSKLPAWQGHAVVVPAASALPSRGDPDAEELAHRAQDAFDEELAHRTREETERLQGACMAEKISTATPSGLQAELGAAGVSWHEVQTLLLQLALQSQCADDLQAQVDELQHALDRKEVEMEELMKVGGTERQSAYIARLLAKITALGGDKKEFDQT